MLGPQPLAQAKKAWREHSWGVWSLDNLHVCQEAGVVFSLRTKGSLSVSGGQVAWCHRTGYVPEE